MHIKEIRLQTNDPAGTIDFYTNILGLHAEETADFVKIRAGSSSIIFNKENNREVPYYHFAFLIPKNLFNDSLSWVQSRMEVLDYSPASTVADFSNWNAKAFYFYDNQQNILEFIAHYDLPPSPGMEFSYAAIQSLHEIGIVTDNVNETCEKIQKETGTPYYIKGPRVSDFAVMGDEDGLFIVTKTLRGWLPTMIPAKKFPLSISFIQDSHEHNIHV